MSTRQRRIAHVTGLLALALSMAAVTSTISARGPYLAASAAPVEAHVFVPTQVSLPAQSEEPAPTF